MQNERSSVKTPSLTKQAKVFNAISIDSTIQGIKTVALLERTAREAEKVQREVRANSEKEKIVIPTGAEIREAREEGEYR